MLQNIPKDKILDIIRQGPTFPTKIAKALGGGADTMLIGAILSTLISSGDLKVSSLKVGGSPLYYIPEQESKLEDFLNYLNEKDKKTFRLLKEEKLLQDSLQDPLTRVSLRAIKDFAKSFEIDFNKQKILFWRFYALSKDEAIALAKTRVTIVEPVVEKPLVEKSKPVVEKTAIQESVIEESIVVSKIESNVKQDTQIIQESVTQESVTHKVDGSSAQTILDSALDSAHDAGVDSSKEKHKHASEHAHKPHHEPHEHHEHKEIKEHKSPEHKDSEHKTIEHKDAEHKNTEHKLSVKPKSPDFFELIQKYVASKNLDIVSKEKLKKSEYDLILKNHATNEYIYCKAKDKSGINEGDLAPALIFAQNKKMPCLFIATGDLTKSAELTLVKEFKGMTFEKIKIEY